MEALRLFHNGLQCHCKTYPSKADAKTPAPIATFRCPVPDSKEQVVCTCQPRCRRVGYGRPFHESVKEIHIASDEFFRISPIEVGLAVGLHLPEQRCNHSRTSSGRGFTLLQEFV